MPSSEWFSDLDSKINLMMDSGSPNAKIAAYDLLKGCTKLTTTDIWSVIVLWGGETPDWLRRQMHEIDLHYSFNFLIKSHNIVVEKSVPSPLPLSVLMGKDGSKKISVKNVGMLKEQNGLKTETNVDITNPEKPRSILNKKVEKQVDEKRRHLPSAMRQHQESQPPKEIDTQDDEKLKLIQQKMKHRVVNGVHEQLSVLINMRSQIERQFNHCRGEDIPKIHEQLNIVKEEIERVMSKLNTSELKDMYQKKQMDMLMSQFKLYK